MSSVTALVTGGTGFVGSRLVRALLARGAKVRVVSSGTGSRERVGDVSAQVAWFAPTDSGLDQACSGVTHFFHFAVAYDRADISDETIDYVNVALPLRVMARLQAHAPAATCVLGDTFFRKFPADATRQVRYTRAKSELARRLADPSQGIDLRRALLQIEQVYGPGDAYTKVLPRVTRQLLAHEPRIPLTHGEQQRDFIHVDDVVAATLTVAHAAWSGLAVVECGTGVGTPVREVFERLHSLTASASVLGFGDLPPDQSIASSTACLDWLRQHGWHAQVALDKGLADLVVDVVHRLDPRS